jgi:hypothetical protein
MNICICIHIYIFVILYQPALYAYEFERVLDVFWYICMSQWLWHILTYKYIYTCKYTYMNIYIFIYIYQIQPALYAYEFGRVLGVSVASVASSTVNSDFQEAIKQYVGRGKGKMNICFLQSQQIVFITIIIIIITP